MTDYSKGKIYKIISASHPDLIYIGSTTIPLNERLQYHKYAAEDDDYMTSKIILNLGDAEIKLIHEFPSNSKLELRMEEQRVMDTFPIIVNKYKAYISADDKKERNRVYNQKFYLTYYQEHRQEIIKRSHDNYNKRKDKISKKRLAKYMCGCGVESLLANKNRHEKTAFHLQNISK